MDELELLEKLEHLDGMQLTKIASLAHLLKRCPGIGNPRSRDHGTYPLEVRQLYKTLRKAVPPEYGNEFLVRYACGEFK